MRQQWLPRDKHVTFIKNNTLGQAKCLSICRKRETLLRKTRETGSILDTIKECCFWACHVSICFSYLLFMAIVPMINLKKYRFWCFIFKHMHHLKFQYVLAIFFSEPVMHQSNTNWNISFWQFRMKTFHPCSWQVDTLCLNSPEA